MRCWIVLSTARMSTLPVSHRYLLSRSPCRFSSAVHARFHTAQGLLLAPVSSLVPSNLTGSTRGIGSMSRAGYHIYCYHSRSFNRLPRAAASSFVPSSLTGVAGTPCQGAYSASKDHVGCNICPLFRLPSLGCCSRIYHTLTLFHVERGGCIVPVTTYIVPCILTGGKGERGECTGIGPIRVA